VSGCGLLARSGGGSGGGQRGGRSRQARGASPALLDMSVSGWAVVGASSKTAIAPCTAIAAPGIAPTACTWLLSPTARATGQLADMIARPAPGSISVLSLPEQVRGRCVRACVHVWVSVGERMRGCVHACVGGRGGPPP